MPGKWKFLKLLITISLDDLKRAWARNASLNHGSPMGEYAFNLFAKHLGFDIHNVNLKKLNNLKLK